MLRKIGVLLVIVCCSATMMLAQSTVTTTGGTANSVPKFTSSSSIGNSAITESGGNVGIGTGSPSHPLDVQGYSGTTQTNLSTFSNGTNGAYTAFDSAGRSSDIGSWNNGAQVLEFVPYSSGNGIISAADGTFQSTAGGAGTITGVVPGSGLTGGGYAGNVTLNLDSTVPRSSYTNYFSGSNIFNGGLQSTIGSTFRNTNLGTIIDFYSDYRGQWITTLYQNGNFETSGGIVRAYKAFRIDHPLDPANKYLLHTSVESPDMKTIYDGVAEIGADGSAWVDLPEYFEALNGGFRYQLTAIGAPAPTLYIAAEISGNRFQIAGGAPGVRVSWQVTGIRHDPYAKTYPTPVELKKAQPGTYLYPELFGQPAVPIP